MTEYHIKSRTLVNGVEEIVYTADATMLRTASELPTIDDVKTYLAGLYLYANKPSAEQVLSYTIRKSSSGSGIVVRFARGPEILGELARNHSDLELSRDEANNTLAQDLDGNLLYLLSEDSLHDTNNRFLDLDI